MSPFRGSSRGNPVWLLWVIWGATFAFIAFVVGSWFWLQRPIDFEERDVYGVWVSDGQHPTVIQFKRDGVAVVSGSRLPQEAGGDRPSIIGKTNWWFRSSAVAERTWVSIGDDQIQSLYAENDWFSTSLVLYIGDPDQPGSRVEFTRRSGG